VSRDFLFADVALSRRLEQAEGEACVDFAAAGQRVYPETGAKWIACAGAYAVFDGIDSPVTQTFGLGLFEELAPRSLDFIERFFLDLKAPVFHEVSPFIGAAALDLLCSRAYRPTEISNVLVRSLTDVGNEECRIATSPNSGETSRVDVRVIDPDQSRLWSDISAKGWSHEHPELRAFLLEMAPLP